MRLLICAGGTGGGVYPALSILQAIGSAAQPVLWVGGQGGPEADLVQRAGIPFTSIPAAGLHGIGLHALPGNLWQMIKGLAASYKILSQFKPEVILFTGGYVAGPMAVVRGNIPSLLFVPDIEPGLALRFLIFTASRIAIICQESHLYIGRKKSLVETGYPIRAELKAWNRATGRTHLALNDDLPVILIAGGSSGAHSINMATLKNLPKLLKICQIVHISGKSDWSEVEKYQAELPTDIKEHYHPFNYLHEMGAALASADLVISRAGGSTLGEYPYFGLPAVLVPYPHAWRYQKVNASYLQDQGAASILWDEDLDSKFYTTVVDLLGNPSQIEKMRAAMLSLRVPDAAEKLAAQVLQMAQPRRSKT